jgi:hypothetical protein
MSEQQRTHHMELRGAINNKDPGPADEAARGHTAAAAGAPPDGTHTSPVPPLPGETAKSSSTTSGGGRGPSPGPTGDAPGLGPGEPPGPGARRPSNGAAGSRRPSISSADRMDASQLALQISRLIDVVARDRAETDRKFERLLEATNADRAESDRKFDRLLEATNANTAMIRELFALLTMQAERAAPPRATVISPLGAPLTPSDVSPPSPEVPSRVEAAPPTPAPAGAGPAAAGAGPPVVLPDASPAGASVLARSGRISPVDASGVRLGTAVDLFTPEDPWSEAIGPDPHNKKAHENIYNYHPRIPGGKQTPEGSFIVGSTVNAHNQVIINTDDVINLREGLRHYSHRGEKAMPNVDYSTYFGATELATAMTFIYASPIAPRPVTADAWGRFLDDLLDVIGHELKDNLARVPPFSIHNNLPVNSTTISGALAVLIRNISSAFFRSSKVSRNDSRAAGWVNEAILNKLPPAVAERVRPDLGPGARIHMSGVTEIIMREMEVVLSLPKGGTSAIRKMADHHAGGGASGGGPAPSGTPPKRPKGSGKKGAAGGAAAAAPAPAPKDGAAAPDSSVPDKACPNCGDMHWMASCTHRCKWDAMAAGCFNGDQCVLSNTHLNHNSKYDPKRSKRKPAKTSSAKPTGPPKSA